MDSSSAFGGIAAALANPNYRRFWASNALSTMGRWVYRTAVGWLTWELTESTGWLGVIAFCDIFPMMVFSIIAGAVADRVGYIRVMRVNQFLSFSVASVFAILTLAGLITIESVVVLTILFGSIEAMTVPSRVAVVNALVRRQDLSAAIALNSATFNASRMVGPAIAGALILWVNTGTVMALAALAFCQLFFVLLLLPSEGAGGSGKLSFELFADIRNGLVYSLRHPGIRFLMIVLSATGLFIRPFMEMLPGFSADVFGHGADGLAILLSSIGCGGMCACLWLARRGRTEGLTALTANALMISGIALILFTFTGIIWIGAAFLVMVGFFMLVGGVSAQTLMQNAADSAVRARVMSLYIVLTWGLPAIGALSMGWLASFFGLQHTVGAAAAASLLVWLGTRPMVKDLAPALEGVEPGRAMSTPPALGEKRP